MRNGSGHSNAVVYSTSRDGVNRFENDFICCGEAMSSFGLGSSKPGRVADSSMMTRNIKLVAQGQADATYADTQKKNPFRLSTAILNGISYKPANLALQNLGVPLTPSTPPITQIIVDLFSPFNSATWTLNASAQGVFLPSPGAPSPSIQLAYDVPGGNSRRSSTFNDNAVINVTYPFTLTETFQTIKNLASATPTDGFVLALSPYKNFIGNGGGNLGIVGGASPALGISINFGGTFNSGTAQIATNITGNPYNASKINLGLIWSDVTSNASTDVKVSVTYDGSNTMAWSVSEGAYLVSSSQTGIDLATLFGSSNAYFGATAGTGARFQPVYLTGATYQTYT